MSHIAYVNGRYLPQAQARIHIEDRGYQFADGVYEVVTVLGGELIDEPGHLDRLKRSLAELKISPPLGEPALKLIMRELLRRNGVRNGFIYLQVTRGVAPRDFRFPAAGKSALVMTTRRSAPISPLVSERGVNVITVPDIRWTRRDIKSVGLLAQVLAKQAAVEAGAFEAWMVGPDGLITEGSSSNAWIVTKDGVLVTRQADHSILKGITGNSLEALAGEIGLKVERRAFTPTEAYEAREAFLTSATTICMPVTSIDGHPVANGCPGEIVRSLRQRYLEYAAKRQGEAFRWQA